MSHTINIADATLMGEILMLRLKSKPDMDEAQNFANEVKSGPGKLFAGVFGEVRKKRSLTSNAYAWTLMNQLAEKLKKPAVEIYRDLVRDVAGASDIVTIKQEATETFKRGWESQGQGWQVVFCWTPCLHQTARSALCNAGMVPAYTTASRCTACWN
jgi:hypothetical protein